MEWETERKRMLDKLQEERNRQRREQAGLLCVPACLLMSAPLCVQEAAIAAQRQKAMNECGEELMGDADALWAEVAAANKAKKKKKPRHQKN